VYVHKNVNSPFAFLKVEGMKKIGGSVSGPI